MKKYHTYIIKYEFRRTSNKCLVFFYTHGRGALYSNLHTYDFGDAAPSVDNSPGHCSDLYVILLFEGGGGGGGGEIL